MLAGAVVSDGMEANELVAHGDLDGVAYDGDLDLTAPVLVAYPVVGPGEADVPRGVHLAGDRGCRGRGA
jgi:hypothetical protein